MHRHRVIDPAACSDFSVDLLTELLHRQRGEARHIGGELIFDAVDLAGHPAPGRFGARVTGNVQLQQGRLVMRVGASVSRQALPSLCEQRFQRAGDLGVIGARFQSIRHQPRGVGEEIGIRALLQGSSIH